MWLRYKWSTSHFLEKESTVTSCDFCRYSDSAFVSHDSFKPIQQPCLALPRSTRGTPRRWATLATSTTRWTWPAWRPSRASRSTTSSRRHRRQFVQPFSARLGAPRSNFQTCSNAGQRRFQILATSIQLRAGTVHWHVFFEVLPRLFWTQMGGFSGTAFESL